MALADTARLIASLELEDKFTPGINKAQTSLSRLQTGGEQVGRGIRQVGTGLTQLGTRAAVVAAGGLTAVIKTAVDFESAFAGVAKTVEATPEQLAELNEGFRELARTIPLSFEEFAAIGEQAGALGIARQDILEFTEVVAKIGTTTDVASEDAATALGQLSNVLKLTAEDYDNFGAALVDLGNKGASTESQILQITSRAGAGAKLIGLTADQTLAWASAVANLGVEAEAGGTALQEFALRSAKSVESAKGLATMAETAGVTGSAFKKAFEEDASGALQTFLVGLGKLDRGAQLQVLDDLNLKGSRLQRVLLGLAGDNDNLVDSLKNSADAWKENAALNEEAEKRYATTASKLTILKNNVRDAANTIGSQLLPVVADLSTELVEFINQPDTQRKIKEFADDLAKGARELVDAFKAGEFDPLIENLKGAAAFAKTAFNAFNALPDPIKQVLIAGAVANKVTGGAVGLLASGAANIVKGIIGIVGSLRGSSPATPLFTKEVGITAGGGGLPGGGGGLLGKLGGALGFVGIVAAAVTALDQLESAIDGVDFAASKTGHNLLDNLFNGRDMRQGAATPIGQFVPQNQGGTIPVKVKELPPGVFEATELAIDHFNRDITKQVRAGDILQAARDQRQLLQLHRVQGTIDTRTNRIAIRIGEVNQGLSKANRNLDEGNQEQREIARRVSEARDRIGSGFTRTNQQLGIVARKDFSPNVKVTVPVTTNVSISDIVRQASTYNVATSYASQLRRGLTP